MKAAVYARYSSLNQDESSITAQLRAIRDYAQKNGVAIVKEYIDEARSATTDDRPQFLEMMDDISSGRAPVDFVYVHKLDRFARNRFDAALYRKELQKKGVRLIAVAQPLDDSPESSLLEGVLESINEFYSKNLARETMKGLRENAYAGFHCGGRVSLGWDTVIEKVISKNGNDKILKKYAINEKEAEIVRFIFTAYDKGVTLYKIRDDCFAKGYRSKTGKPLTINSIRTILENWEKYTGNFVFNRAYKDNHRKFKPEEEIIKIPGGMPQIIEKDLGERIGLKLKKAVRITLPRHRSDNLYILTGKLVCGECGSPMTGIREAKESWYACTAKKRNKTCNNKNIRKVLIEKLILDKLQSIFVDDGLVDKLIAQSAAQSKEAEGEIKVLKKELNDLSGKMDRLFAAIESGMMEAAVAGPRLNSLSHEKDMITARINELSERKSLPKLSRKQIELYVKQNRQTLTDRSNLPDCKRLIDTYIIKITLDNEGYEITSKFYPQTNSHTYKLVVPTGFEPVSPP